MPSLAAFLAPFALLLPGMGGTDAGDDDNRLLPREVSEESSEVTYEGGLLTIETIVRDPVNNQVRIERRVIIRIAPQSRAARQNLTSSFIRRQNPADMVERKIGKCLPIDDIAAVTPTTDNRLVLFMRDQRLMTAQLEKACNARDFYSGFYVEQNKDGQLCVDRDKVRSRTGATCEMDRLRQLVADDD